MKKSFILALAMAAPAFAGTPMTMPSPEPVVCPLNLEVGASYTLACRDLDNGIDGADMLGLDVTGVYNLNDNWAITLRLGWARGEGDTDWGFDVDFQSWNIMPGVRYTAPINDKLSWYAGANMGVGSLDVRTTWYRDKETGFAASVEAGVKYDVCESTYLYGGVYGYGCTADPAVGHDQIGVGIRAGVGFEF